MRLVQSLLLLSAVAVAAAGCTSQPAYVQMAPYGIDNVTYGTPQATYGYAQPAYPQPVQQAYAQPAYVQPTYVQPAYAQPAYATPQAAYGYAQPVSPNVYAYAGGARPGYGYAATTQGPYQLDSGDRLRIVVFGQDGLTNSYAVDASGHIAMPLIGSVSARGLTTDQLGHAIADKLRDGYIREPHVAVEVESYRPFFILGEVTQPGQYPYVANMTAETAVAIAGGFGPRASRQSVVLIRNYNGQQMRMAVPLSYPLRPGDTINVQERWF
jgi:polysaccharide biosynthesis/export protein